MTRCFSCPSMTMAETGRAGHTHSHFPHPMHRSVSMMGIFGALRDESSFCAKGTIWMAPVGQCRAQFPHERPLVTGMHCSRIQTAWPI